MIRRKSFWEEKLRRICTYFHYRNQMACSISPSLWHLALDIIKTAIELVFNSHHQPPKIGRVHSAMKAFLLIVTPLTGDPISLHTISDSTAGAIEQHILDFWPYKKIEARPA